MREFKMDYRTFMFIALRFGQGMTIKEVGKALRMTRERVRQYEGKVLREVRANGGIPNLPMNNRKLEGFLELK